VDDRRAGLGLASAGTSVGDPAPHSSLLLHEVAPRFPASLVRGVLEDEVELGRVVEEGGCFRLAEGAFAPDLAAALRELER
jgi:hypothetical protein